MNLEKFFKLFKESLIDFYKKPLVIVCGIVLWMTFYGVGAIGGSIAYNFDKTIENVIWVVISGGVLAGISGFILSGMIGLSLGKGFFKNAKKFWLENSGILILFVLLFEVINLLLFVFTWIMINVNFKIPENGFKIISLIISFIWLVGIMIFFTFSNFTLVVGNLRIKQAVKKSFSLVKNSYLFVLGLNILSFLAFLLIGEVDYIGIVSFVVILPYYVFVLTRFVSGEK